MIVYLNPFFEVSIHEKTAFIYEHVKWMTNFFQDRAYGASVNVFALGAVADTEEQLQYYGFGINYSRRTKNINSLFKIDLAFASKSSNADFLSHLEMKIYDEIAKFQELKLKDFDQNNFLIDMKEFFQIIKTTETNSLNNKFQDFNEEVKNWQEKKVKQFLRSK
jgi:hypothetical protein